MHVQIHSQSISIKVGLEGISGYQSPPLFREPQSYPFGCWQQVLTLSVQQHPFSLQAVDVHFIFLHLLLNATEKQLEFSAVSLNCAWAWGLEVWRRELSGLCWPLGGFLAVSLSHTCRHLLRSCLSEVLTGGALVVGWNTGISCDLEQYSLPVVDGLILTVGNSWGVGAHRWTCSPHCFRTLLSAYVLRWFLTWDFAHFLPVPFCSCRSFPALPPLPPYKNGNKLHAAWLKLQTKQPSPKHPLFFWWARQ